MTCTNGQCMYNATWRHVRAAIVAMENQWVIYNLTVCISILRYPACYAYAPYCHPAQQTFSTLSHKRQNFRKKSPLNIKCVFLFYLRRFSETFFILRRTERDMIKIYILLHVRYILFLSDFNKTWIFSTVFRKIQEYQNFMIICPVGAELFYADRRTDKQDESNSRFSQFCEKRLKSLMVSITVIVRVVAGTNPDTKHR